MGEPKLVFPDSHVVDILGSVTGRDQPIMLMEKATELLACLDESVFLDPNTVFLDPFCKAGEVLLAAAAKACFVKNKKKHLVSSSEIFQELYTGRYFGIAPDDRHFYLSRRTFYGNEKSHDKKLTKNIVSGKYVSDETGELNRRKFEKELLQMIEYIKSKKPHSKIIAVGNPPYQEADGGFGKSASPIYNFFFEALMNSGPIGEFLLVIPSRWFSGGKGLAQFRKDVIRSGNIKTIRLFKDPRAVFPTVDINGGVCFIHFDKNHGSLCTLIDGSHIETVSLNQLDAIPDDIFAYELIGKIKKRCSSFMSEYVLPRNPFGITSTTLRSMPKKFKGGVACLVKERKRIQVPKNLVTKNEHLVRLYKVAVPAAVGGTKAIRDFLPINQFFIVEPNVVMAETYIVVGAFETKSDADKLLAYVKTNFCRYFIGLRKLTQHLSQDCWSWVPEVRFDIQWTDDLLFEHFKFSKREREHILRTVKDWS